VADALWYDCNRCGSFVLTGTAEATLPGKIDVKPNRRALMSHKLRRMYEREKKPVWVDSNFDAFWVDDRLPSPQQQLDSLILWLGDTLVERAPSDQVGSTVPFLSAWIGAGVYSDGGSGLVWLLNELEEASTAVDGNTEFFRYDRGTTDAIIFQMKFPGWSRYEELKTLNPDSRTAFIALKFGDSELNRVVENCFKPAVRRTGFELRLLTDEQPAGLIDNQIRAAILSARFVIADLSHGSHGAYWEAGFAEGHGLPVIYTCKRAAWNETKTHFDTNHLLTILWDANNLPQVERELVATIRATLREHAKQSDD
jgi:hypothetical protein